MNITYSTSQANFGLLPEPERNPASFLTSCIVNSVVLALLIVFGRFAHHEIELKKMESTEIYFPVTPPPQIKVKVKLPPQTKLPPLPEPKIAKLEAPKIFKPKAEPKPEPKLLPVMKEAVALPTMPAAKPQIVLAQQPKAALPVALRDTNGVKPNPNATAPANIAALSSTYGSAQGQSANSRGVVGSAGFGNGTRSGSGGGNGNSSGGGNGQGKVAAAGIPGMTSGNAPSISTQSEKTTTPPILVSHAEPEYTSEARQLKIEGDVVLRVTITTSGEMLVHSVLRGLGHGLDEAATRSAPTYKFKPATRDGQPVEYTTNIIIKFQTA